MLDLVYGWCSLFSLCRGYAIVTTHKHEVNEIIECFEADWTRGKFTPGEHSHLIWCVENGRQRLDQFIDEAKESLWLQNERLKVHNHGASSSQP